MMAETYPHVAYSYCCHCYYDPEAEAESQPASPGSMSEGFMMEVDRPRTGHGGRRPRQDQGEFRGISYNMASLTHEIADSKKRKIRTRLRQFLQRGCC